MSAFVQSTPVPLDKTLTTRERLSFYLFVFLFSVFPSPHISRCYVGPPRSPDLPAHSQSLYQMSYLAYTNNRYNCIFWQINTKGTTQKPSNRCLSGKGNNHQALRQDIWEVCSIFSAFKEMCIMNLLPPLHLKASTEKFVAKMSKKWKLGEWLLYNDEARVHSVQ
jgi:hypothetical protein